MKAILAGLASLVAAAVTQASTITYTLTSNAASGTYVVTGATSTGDNFGFASYQFVLSNVLTVTQAAPRRGYDDPNGNTVALGFGTNASNNNVLNVTGSQDTATANVPQVYNVGQLPGSVTASVAASPFGAGYTPTGNQQRDAFVAPVVLVTGTYSVGGAAPLIALNGGFATAGNLYNNTTSSSASPATNVVLVQPTAPPIPEPASLAVLGLSGAGILARRRRAAVSA